MAETQAYVGTKVPDWMDPSKAEMPLKLGIYKGIVKQVDTGTRTSRVYVYIAEFGGNNQDLSVNWNAQVSYAAPFGGYTTGVLNQSGNGLIARNDFTSTQQTYGFTAGPPDIGSQVLCCFPNGSKMEGYWFAVVNPNLSQNMLPAIGSVPLDLIDPVSVPSDLVPLLTPGGSYPVSEFNTLSDAYNSDWTKTLRPLHIPQTLNLIRQGLDQDPSRGAINSSAQRDPIGSVYGFSTPGRPFGTQDPANDANLRNKLLTGDFNPADYVVTTRVGGHSLVMDDGDIYGKSNLVRLKTSAGHQLLMDDKDGFMYIANSTGTAWIELTKSGDILVYGANDLSVRAQGNMMFHSDKNINFNAEGSINLNASAAIKAQAQAIETVATQFLNLFGKNAQLSSGGLTALGSGSNLIIRAPGKVAINGSGGIALNGSGGGGTSAPPSPIPKYKVPDSTISNNRWAVQDKGLTSINYKVPTHEPYIRGSIASVIAAQEEYAAALANAMIGGDSIKDVEGNIIQPDMNVPNTGYQQAQTQDVTKPAPTSAFIKQPDPGKGLGNLDADGLRAYMAQTAYSESGGSYTATNQFGYQGKYQLGSAALQDLGYVKPGTPQTPEALNNPNNWTGKDGVASSSDFLNNPQVQETAMYDYTKRNYATLQSKGLISSDTTPDVAAGLLSASHLVGPGGAAKWYTSGQSVADANGTTASAYFNRGRYSQTQVPVITASNNSKTTTA